MVSVLSSGLIPVALIAYLSVYIDPSLVFKDFLFHEIVIGIAVLWSGSIAYVSYQCYLSKNEVFLRYMALGFIGQTIVYSMHGILTRTAEGIPILFILYGPASRIILAAFLLLALLKYTVTDRNKMASKWWVSWTVLFILLLPLVALLAVSPIGTNYYVRFGMELSAILMYVIALGIFFYRKIDTPLMWLFAIALVMFAESSVAFIFVEMAWNHMFWLGHIIFVSGFFVLSYGLIKARKRSSSFSEVFNEEVLYEKLAEQVSKLELEIITRTRAEENLNIAKDEAEQANLAKSKFIASMSHELRTPLNAILGFAQLLKIDALNDERKESLQEIISAGDHLLMLVNQVLDLSEIESGNVPLKIDKYDLNTLINDSLLILKAITDKHSITINNKIDSSLDLTINVDKGRFKQVLLNLLSNAIKYNSKDGKITIECLSNDDNMLSLSIIDTGMGLSAEQQNHLFKPFDRAGAENSSIEGIGLGLVISKDLIEQMNGMIGFESESGKGSRFWIKVPLS